jgi:hypothetical protein
MLQHRDDDCSRRMPTVCIHITPQLCSYKGAPALNHQFARHTSAALRQLQKRLYSYFPDIEALMQLLTANKAAAKQLAHAVKTPGALCHHNHHRHWPPNSAATVLALPTPLSSSTQCMVHARTPASPTHASHCMQTSTGPPHPLLPKHAGKLSPSFPASPAAFHSIIS